MISDQILNSAKSLSSSMVNPLKNKYLIFFIIFTFIGIIIVVNIFSYVNILTKADENPLVPKTRAQSGLVINIIILVVIIVFCGYYIYKFSDKSGFLNIFRTSSKPKTGFPSSVVIPDKFSSCADSKPLIPFKDYIAPIDLKPKKCIDCKTYPDPSKTTAQCRDNYNAQGVLKSVR
jgi:hypothetical protein